MVCCNLMQSLIINLRWQLPKLIISNYFHCFSFYWCLERKAKFIIKAYFCTFVNYKQNVLVIFFKLNCYYQLCIFEYNTFGYNAFSYIFFTYHWKNSTTKKRKKLVYKYKILYKSFLKTKIAIKTLSNISLKFKII